MPFAIEPKRVKCMNVTLHCLPQRRCCCYTMCGIFEGRRDLHVSRKPSTETQGARSFAEELASRLHVVRQTISKWEKGQSVPDAEQLIKLAVILETTVSELLGTQAEGKEEPNQLAKELSRINTQLAIRNHRTRRVLKIIAVALLAFVALIFAIMALNYAPMS